MEKLLLCCNLQKEYQNVYSKSIVKNCLDKINSYLDNGDKVLFSNDIHFEKVYDNQAESKYKKIHCYEESADLLDDVKNTLINRGIELGIVTYKHTSIGKIHSTMNKPFANSLVSESFLSNFSDKIDSIEIIGGEILSPILGYAIMFRKYFTTKDVNIFVDLKYCYNKNRNLITNEVLKSIFESNYIDLKI